MCTAISFDHREFIEELVIKYGLDKKLMTHDKPNEFEVRFQYQDKMPLLPIRHEAETGLSIHEWGNRDHKESRLPHTGWCRVESLDVGKWDWLRPERVIIPATHGLEKGIWFPIYKGMAGVTVLDEEEQKHVYMLTQPADDAYKTLTRHERMPVFL